MIYLLLAPYEAGQTGQAIAFDEEQVPNSNNQGGGQPERIKEINVFILPKNSNFSDSGVDFKLHQPAATVAAHALLSTQPLLWDEQKRGPLSFDFLLRGDVNTKISGDSGGLVYSLALLQELTRYDPNGGQHFSDAHQRLTATVIAATGTIDQAGQIGHVNDVGAKLTALVAKLQQDWPELQASTQRQNPRIVILLAKENLAQLDQAQTQQIRANLLTLSPQVEMVGVTILAEAIHTLLGDSFPVAQQDFAPYKGLSAFEPQDRVLFFGREQEVNDTLVKLAEHAANPQAHRHCLVFGDSGSGKSSFVKAGLLPRLCQQNDSTLQNWAILKPGDAQGQLLDYLIHCLQPTLDSKDQDPSADLPWRNEPRAAVQGFMTLYSKALTAPHASPVTETKTGGCSPVFVLVIDQAEEILRSPATKQELTAFKTVIKAFSTHHLKANSSAAQPEPVVWVISAVRLSDYENYKSLLELENEQAQYLPYRLAVLNPSEDNAAYRAIIENPAKLRGITVEPELTDRLMAAIVELENPLPTLEYTLHELYLHAVKTHSLAKGLTLANFKDTQVIGNMKDLITRNAQALLDELQQEAPVRKRTADFFSLLLGVDITQGFAYSKTAKSEAFKKPPELNRLYQAFVSHRFLSESDDNNVRFCHEVLIREWETVRTWATNTAQKERNRKVRNLAAGLVFSIALVLVAAYAAYYAKQQSVQAKKERDNALIIQSKFLADLSRKHTESGNTRLGALLAVEALPDYSKKIEDRRPLVNEALASVNQVISHVIDIAWLKNTGKIEDATFSPNGHQIVTATSEDHKAQIWDATTGKELVTLEGHTSYVRTATYSPDGRHIVTASWDTTARIWNSKTGQLEIVLKGHTSLVNTSAYSPDGHHILTASEDKTARIWNSKTGQLEIVLKGHTSGVNTAAYSPDGRQIVTQSSDNTARIWSAETGQQVFVLEGHTNRVNSAAYSPNGHYIVTASDDKTARIWDAQSGQLEIVLEGHTSGVYTAVYSPDGHHILTASGDKTARIWDAQTGQLEIVLEGHTSGVNTAAYSPDGRHILTASGDQTARIWNAQTGQLITVLKGYEWPVNTAKFSTDGQYIVTTSNDSAHLAVFGIPRSITLLEWHVEKEPLMIGREEKNAIFSPDGRHIIVTSSWDNSIPIWNVINRKLVAVLKGRIVYQAAYSPDGRRIVTVSEDQTAQIWNVETGQLVTVLGGHAHPMKTAAYSPDGRYIVTASYDKTARIWNAETGQLVSVLEGNSSVVRTAAFRPDGRHIVTASDDIADFTPRIWNAETGQLVAVLKGHDWVVNSATYSPDGRHIVTGSADFTAKIWNAETGELVRSIVVPSENVKAKYSPDGHHIVTLSLDKLVRIWKAKTGLLEVVLKGHDRNVNTVEYSPDGRYIVTSSNDKTARIWEANTGEQVAVLTGHTDYVTFAAYSPDGRHIVTASHDGTARIWALYEAETILEQIKRLNISPLTPEERRENYLD